MGKLRDEVKEDMKRVEKEVAKQHIKKRMVEIEDIDKKIDELVLEKNRMDSGIMALESGKYKYDKKNNKLIFNDPKLEFDSNGHTDNRCPDCSSREIVRRGAGVIMDSVKVVDI